MRYLPLAYLMICLVPTASRAQTDVWTLVPGTSAQSIAALATDLKCPDTLYVGTTTGISKYRVSTLAAVGSQVLVPAVSGIAVHPASPDTLYAGSTSNAAGTGGVYRTTDRGATWPRLGTQPTYTTVFSVAVDVKVPNSIYAGTFVHGIHKGTGGGAAWADFSDSTLVGISVSDIALPGAGQDTVLYGATLSAGGFKKVNSGRWTQLAAGLPAVGVNLLRPDPVSPGTLYSGSTDGVYKSTDAGASWVRKSTGIPTGKDIKALVVSPSRPSVVYAGAQTGEVYRTADSGDTWEPLTTTLPGLPIQAMAIDPTNHAQIYVGTSSGVYVGALKSVPKQVSWEVGKGPTSIVAANLDTSALADLAIANATDNTVTVLLNRGGGTFSRRDVPAGSGPRSLVAADLDGDGKRDLVACNRVGRSLTVLKNDGFGRFTFALDLFVGRSVESVAAGDLDGDGDVDLATANGDANSVSIFLNGGRGTFLPGREQSVGAGARSVAAADLNGDGRPDLAAADQTGDAVSILINQGGGTFAADAPVALSGGPNGVLVRDLNADGAADLVVLTAARNSIAVLNGNGNGTFQAPVLIPFSEPAVAADVADLDGDRYPDLVLGFRGTAISLLNDGNGKLASGPSFGTLSGISAVVSADYEGDGKPDAAAVSSDAAAVVLYRNAIPQTIKRPSPPRNLSATDTPADLGGRITLTWQQPRVDEETGRVTAYEVYRSTARDGSYGRILTVEAVSPFSTRDTTWVNRAVVDSTATVGVPLFYQIVTRNASGTASVPSAIVSATSVPQPFFSFDFSNTGLYSVGDTVAVRVILNPLDYRLSGLSLFLDYNSRALTLLDADATKAGVQPFSLNTNLISGGVQVLENRQAGEGLGRINLSLGSLALDQNLPVDIGILRFTTPRDTVAALTISNDAATNRRTLLINAADGAALSPNLPPQPASVLIRNYRVNGSVRFQGRADHLDLSVRVDLRQGNGQGLPFPYAPPNDQDKVREGVQLVLDKTGGFSLIQVPAGRYSVFVKGFHYLRGRVTGDSIAVGGGTATAPMTFRWVSSAGTAFTEVRGGDANNDNNVNLTDFGLLAKHFGAFGITGAQQAAWVADFNGDGKIDLADFSILTSNFGEQGLGQTFAPKPAPPSGRLRVARASGAEGEVFRISAEGVSRVSGFSLDLVYGQESRSDAISDAVLSEGGDARRQGLTLWWIVRPIDRGVRIAGFVRGSGVFDTKDGGEVAFLALSGRRKYTLPDLRNAWLADLDGETVPASALASDLPPQEPALFQNVPNPFNPVTTIPYDVAEAGGSKGDDRGELRVMLRIYSLTGQVVRTLVDAQRSPGRYRAEWDGRDDLGHSVASGVYFYRLDIASFRDVKRMLLLR